MKPSRESLGRALDEWKAFAARLGACYERERHKHPPNWSPTYWELITLLRQEAAPEAEGKE